MLQGEVTTPWRSTCTFTESPCKEKARCTAEVFSGFVEVTNTVGAATATVGVSVCALLSIEPGLSRQWT